MGRVILGFALADFILKNWKFFKRNWGEFRSVCIDELSVEYSDSRQILINFFSEKEVYEMLKKLPKGSDSDFENFLQAFQDFCKGSSYEFDPKEIIKEIKFGAELGEADTSFEKISLRYLQKASENDGKLLEKMGTMDKDVKKGIEKLDELGKNNVNKTFEQFSDDSSTYNSYIEELKSKLDPQPKIKFNTFFMADHGST